MRQISFTTCFFVFICLAQAGAVETPRLLFSASFENQLDSEESSGNPIATVSPGGVNLEEGHNGMGVRVETGGLLSYEIANNLNTRNGTLAFWFKPLTPIGTRTNWDRLFDTHDANGSSLRLQFVKGSPGFYAALSADGNTSITPVISVADWEVGQWRHVTLTWDSQVAVI